jgi:hypothetical protein
MEVKSHSRSNAFMLGRLQRICAFGLLAFVSANESQAAIALPICPGDQVSDAYALTVDGQPVPVGSSEFNGEKTFHVAAFESDRPVQASVKLGPTAGNFSRLRPKRANRNVRIANGVAKFQILPGEKLVLESHRAPPLFLFALPEEKAAPQPGDAGVVYFGPGEHEAGGIRLKSGETLYLAAGARVKGRVYSFEARDVAIRGRGVLDARGFTDRDQKIHGVLFERCRNVAMEGVQIRTGDWWQVLFLLTDNARVDHVHTLSFGVNNDGIDTDGVTNLKVRNSFIGCGDDGFGIHAVDAVTFGEPATQNILAENCVIWNEHAGNGLRVGASTETGEMSNIVFRSIDVLKCMNNAIMIDHSDWATMRNIVLDDFRNDTPKLLANIFVDKTHYSNSIGYRDERGRIEGLVFRDCTSSGGDVSVRGFDETHDVRGVRLINLEIQDRPVKFAEELTLGEFVRDVQFAAKPSLQLSKPPAVKGSTRKELVLDNGGEGCWAFAGENLHTIEQKGSHNGTAWRIDRLGWGRAAAYEPRLEGRYEVAVYWGDQEGAATTAPWTVFHRDGYTTQLLDQNHSAGWHRLGKFQFGPESWVRLVDPHYALSDGPVIADAVRFRRVDTSANVNAPSPGFARD